jgi:hypothetical protein
MCYLLTLPAIFFPTSLSLDLAPGDFYFFTYLKQFFGCMCMGSNEEVKKTVKDWFNGLVAEFYDVGIQKLIT